MCGRYTSTRPADELQQLFALDAINAEVLPRWNIAPTQQALVVVGDGRHRTLEAFRWGLVPSWAQDASVGARAINARAETLDEKATFKHLIGKRHCLVVADGFYEWKRAGREKVPHFIFPADGKPFAFAGLWDEWRAPTGLVLRTFTIITTSPNEQLVGLHDRMPVMLRPEQFDAWLSPRSLAFEAAGNTLSPYPGRLEVRPVSDRVSQIAHDDAACAAFSPLKQRSLFD